MRQALTADHGTLYMRSNVHTFAQRHTTRQKLSSALRQLCRQHCLRFYDATKIVT